MKLNQLLSILPLDEHVYITGHVHPDGDCLGAALGLYHILKNHSYNVTVILEERPKVYNYLSGFNSINDFLEYSNLKESILSSDYSLVVVDSGDLSRIEPIIELFMKASITINIDHHESNNLFAMYNFVDTKASSTSEMIGLLLDLESGDASNLTKEIAECLFTGIIYDTGVFKHSNTRFETHMVASYLVKMKINHTFIINHCFFTKSVKAITATKLALDHLTLIVHDTIAMTFIMKDELIRNQLLKSHTESVVNILNEIEGTLGSIFLLEIEPNIFKASFRSSSLLNVCDVAKKFGGGGHIKAAGATITGSKDEVINIILKELEIEYQRYY